MNKEKVNYITAKRLFTTEKFICDICQKDFLSKFYYQIHLVVHSIPEHFDCDNCQEGLNNILSFNKHLEIHNALYIICHVCKKEFSDKASLTEHIKMHGSESKRTLISELEPTNEEFAVETYDDEEYDLCFDSSNTEESTSVENVSSDDLEDLFRCENCNKEFINYVSLNEHVKMHSNECQSTLSLKQEPANEEFAVKIENDETIFPCHLCEKKFAFNSLLDAHLKTHQVKEYVCGVCQKGYDSKDELFDHVHVHAIVKSFSCNVCQKIFSNKAFFDKHVRSHIPKKRFICNVCEKEYLSKKFFIAHVRSHSKLVVNRKHAHVRSHSKLDGNSKHAHVCKICSKSFYSRNNLKRHYLTHTGEKPYQCDTCGVCYTRKTNLTNHQFMHEVKDKSIEEIDQDRAHVCKICSKIFTNARNLRRHSLIHTGLRPFKCETCGACFNQKNILTKHQRLHKYEETISEPCNLCPDGLLNSFGSSRLCRHLRYRPFKCETCEKGFSSKITLMEHQRLHTGEKPYECDTCKKSFHAKGSLISHQSVHLKVKPFKCETCGKRFARKVDFKVHCNTHLEERPFKCGKCEKRFNQRNTLIKHLRIHTEEKPFVCHFCNKRFRRRDHLKSHLHRIHRIDLASNK